MNPLGKFGANRCDCGPGQSGPDSWNLHPPQPSTACSDTHKGLVACETCWDMSLSGIASHLLTSTIITNPIGTSSAVYGYDIGIRTRRAAPADHPTQTPSVPFINEVWMLQRTRWPLVSTSELSWVIDFFGPQLLLWDVGHLQSSSNAHVGMISPWRGYWKVFSPSRIRESYKGISAVFELMCESQVRIWICVLGVLCFSFAFTYFSSPSPSPPALGLFTLWSCSCSCSP